MGLNSIKYAPSVEPLVSPVPSLCINSSVIKVDSVDSELSLDDVSLNVESTSSTLLSSSSSQKSSPSSSDSIGVLVVSTGISSSSTHGSLLHSSFEKAMLSSSHFLASTASPFAIHRTLRDFSPPPHGLLHCNFPKEKEKN